MKTALALQSAAPTPMMAQYLAIKQAHPDSLLFYRMGDFYELFFDDAVAAAAALDIALTRRGQHDGKDIPMCGVPVHSHESYLSKLIEKGFRVAICEQIEDPKEAKKRGAKSVVARDVVRIITQGTITEDGLLEARAHNYLVSLCDIGGQIGLAAIDVSTGQFLVETVTLAEMETALARLEAAEIIVPERLVQHPESFEFFNTIRKRLTLLPAVRFNVENGHKRLLDWYQVASLDGFGDFSRAAIAASGALLDYLTLTQKGQIPHLDTPRTLTAQDGMVIDATTRRSLELNRDAAGSRAGSLLAAIDETCTAAGARHLAECLARPSTNITEITARQAAIATLIRHSSLRLTLHDSLKGMADLQRALGRLVLDRGGPRDLSAIGETLQRAARLRVTLLSHSAGEAGISHLLREIVDNLGEHSALIDRLGRALQPNVPMLARDGGFIAEGYAPALDELRMLASESRRVVNMMQVQLASETGIASLKIKYNAILGYHIEVTASHGDKLLNDPDKRFIHRQTMAGAVRFSTPELVDLDRKIAEAGERAIAMEIGLYQGLRTDVLQRSESLRRCADAVAKLDMLVGLAMVAVERDWVCPVVTDGLDFTIRAGRHPVIEAARLKGHASTSQLMPNDCDLSHHQRLWLMTGPNMAGKSTFLRQNALIAILAQMGSFVPAQSATIGVIDRLFSRVGAADDLARGRSTFMVEMVETAVILHQATAKSLVILDEIGRGTATYDGLSIAWATVEHLHDTVQCRSLFATHYHELTALSARLNALSSHRMAVREQDGVLYFLYEVQAGAADRSYGIHVAELAGLPVSVTRRAREVMRVLEATERQEAGRLAGDLPLFALGGREIPAILPPPPKEVEIPPALRALTEMNPDELTPKQALDALYQLKTLIR